MGEIVLVDFGIERRNSKKASSLLEAELAGPLLKELSTKGFARIARVPLLENIDDRVSEGLVSGRWSLLGEMVYCEAVCWEDKWLKRGD